MGQQPVSFIHMVVKLGYCNAGERNQERSTDLKCQILSTLIIHVGCCSAVNLFNTVERTTSVSFPFIKVRGHL